MKEKIILWFVKYKWLLLIVLLGAGLRFYDLGGEALWTDEMVSLRHVQKESLIDSVVRAELMPPGYFLFLSGWISSSTSLSIGLMFFINRNCI